MGNEIYLKTDSLDVLVFSYGIGEIVFHSNFMNTQGMLLEKEIL